MLLNFPKFLKNGSLLSDCIHRNFQLVYLYSFCCDYLYLIQFLFSFTFPMEDQISKRRQFVSQEIDIPLVFQVVILLRNRKEVMYLCTKSSLALRVICLCEMVINKEIECKNDAIVVTKAANSTISRNFQQSISQVKLDCKHLVKYLNGETAIASGVKDLRNKIYKEMESRGLIKIKKGVMFNKILLNKHETWQLIFNKVIGEVTNKNLSLSTIAILSALDYINGLESLLLQCNEAAAKLVIEAVKEISRERDSNQSTENRLFYDLLAILKK